MPSRGIYTISLPSPPDVTYGFGEEQGSSSAAFQQYSLGSLYSAFPRFAAAYAASWATEMDRAAEDSMFDDTPALLAGPNRLTHGVATMESSDSTCWAQASRRAKIE